MEDKKYYLKAPDEIGGQYFVEASDGVIEYTTLVHYESVGNYRGEFSSDRIKELLVEYPVLKSFTKVDVPPVVEHYYTAIIDDHSIFEDELFPQSMYIVHNRDKDIWSIVPDSVKDRHGWSYILTEDERKYLSNYDLSYQLRIEEAR